MIEGEGIPTLFVGTAHDIMSQVTAPHAVFVDHPVGRTFGEPNNRRRNRAVLTRVLEELAHFSRGGEIRDAGLHWLADGSRSWEEELRAEMLGDKG